MKICYLPADPDGPGSYRCIFPMEQLSKHGHDARLAPHTFDPVKKVGIMYFDIGWDPISPDADVFVLQMPQQDVYLEFTLRARAAGRVVVGETDDDYINLATDHPAFYATAQNSRYNRYWMQKTFAACDALTVTTPALKEVYEAVNPNVHVIPNALDWDMWENVTPQYEVERERVRIGWMGSSHWRPLDIELLAEAVNPFLDDHPEVDFVLVGDNRKTKHLFRRHIYIDGIDFRKRPGLTELQIPKLVPNFDIGLVPLVITPFNQAKSNLKGMEYAACGIPCVASPTDPYKEWVDEGENGFLASNPKEWREKMELLLDPDTRSVMGAKARAKAKRESVQRRWQRWADVYMGLRSSRKPYVPGTIESTLTADMARLAHSKGDLASCLAPT